MAVKMEYKRITVKGEDGTATIIKKLTLQDLIDRLFELENKIEGREFVPAAEYERAERRARIAEFALYRSCGPYSYGFELQRAEQILSESGELTEEEQKEP